MGLSEQIDSLPPEMQAEVADFVAYLHHKRLKQQADSGHLLTQERPSLLDVLEQAPGHLMFQSAEEVDTYIQAERDSWKD